MANFSKSSRNIVLQGSILYAECTNSAGEWQPSMIDLDCFLGNDNGKFKWDSGDFSLSVQDVRLEGSVLYARLEDYGRYLSGSVDLDEHIGNEEGHLKYVEKPSIGFSETSRDLILDGSVLQAECLTTDGEWKQSTLDLDYCLGNDFGEFEWGSTQFSSTAKNIRLEDTVLYAYLKHGPGPNDYQEAYVDLDDGITNDSGNLKCTFATQNLGDQPGMLCQSDNFPPDLLDEETRKERDFDQADAYKSQKVVQAAAALGRQPYEYSPLSSSTNIRLLRIEPQREEIEVVECSLVEFEEPASQKFAALSYTWGSPFPPTVPSIEHSYQQTATIFCNGQSFQVQQNLYDALRRLRHQPAVDEKRGHQNETELIRKAWSGSLIKVEGLLRNGANVNARDNSGRTALHYAARIGHLDIVKALVVAGSDQNAVCDARKTPLDYAREAREARIPSAKSVEEFLIQQEDVKYAADGNNSSLRSNVTQHEYFWIDAVRVQAFLMVEIS
jgi:hypothetical protein